MSGVPVSTSEPQRARAQVRSDCSLCSPHGSSQVNMYEWDRDDDALKGTPTLSWEETCHLSLFVKNKGVVGLGPLVSDQLM